ncbi:hypothetical protein C5748_09630 [Phyllobacterium phragmitis]|uniref:Uncharacterized protein n=1 Tax=Phyllobacterium phragmitis TaxID=2670329 RepID=A0A2S9ISL9_9HYPH|nr:hypothetical protein [Phyllobacterium phragmitis]PRD43524.1 hypothetical protein C5748_09630 [Phyllobacterium phragmitis]
MADYHSPTVITPDLPIADMTALEYLILGLAFDCEPSGEGYVYLHSWCGPSDIVSIEAGPLRAAYDGSIDAQSAINDHIAVLLKGHDAREDSMPGDCIEIDLTEISFGWDRMLQDVVRRSTVLDEIVVTAAFTCTKMRPDGFGGSVMRITSDAIQYNSTTDMLEKMWNTPASTTVPDTAEDRECSS